MIGKITANKHNIICKTVFGNKFNSNSQGTIQSTVKKIKSLSITVDSLITEKDSRISLSVYLNIK